MEIIPDVSKEIESTIRKIGDSISVIWGTLPSSFLSVFALVTLEVLMNGMT